MRKRCVVKIKTEYLNRLKNRLSFGLRPDRTRVHADTGLLEPADTVICGPAINAARGHIHAGLIKDNGTCPYYPKFERFLKNNRISYAYYDIHASSWMEDAKAFSVILWRPLSLPWILEEAREKIYFLERCLHKRIYPSLDEIMFYENKVLQHFIMKHHAFPVIDTFISSDYDEVRDWIETAEYPFVSKIRTGSASQGVCLVKGKGQARRCVERIFRAGNATYWPFQKQKNYVFFQKYVENRGFDLRITVVDENNIFGYFREVPRGDFRASGMQRVIKKELPKEAVKIALAVAKMLGFTNLSVDFLQAASDLKFFIIEASNFIKIETAEQLKIGETPGRYRYVQETDSLIFEAGRYWIQELILRRYLEGILSVHTDGSTTQDHERSWLYST